MKQFSISLVLVLLLLLPACQTKTGFKPTMTGKAGELLVVIDDKYKATQSGKDLLNSLSQSMLGLPQLEPMFDLTVVPHRALTDFMKTYRNLVFVWISPNVKKSGITYYKGSWAKDQAMVRVHAKNESELKELLEKEEVKMMGFLVKAERERAIAYNKRFGNTDLMGMLKKDWQVQLSIPNTYKKNKSGDNFAWMSQETPLTSLGIFVYAFDYVGEGTFSKEYLLNKRDSVLHVNVPGPAKGSYMATEHAFPPSYKVLNLNGVKTVEMRGLWKVNGDLMGGPFISFARLSPSGKRVIVTDGYVFAPEKPNKRNMIRQLEAVFYTFGFTDDKKK